MRSTCDRSIIENDTVEPRAADVCRSSEQIAANAEHLSSDKQMQPQEREFAISSSVERVVRVMALAKVSAIPSAITAGESEVFTSN